MANLIYPKGKQNIVNQNAAYLTDTVKCILVDDAFYTYSAAHQYLSDVPGAARIATSPALTGKTATDGQMDANDPVFSSVAAGGPYENLIFYIDSGVEGTSELLFFIDTATGLPVTTNGTDVTIQVGSYIAAI
jgi:hypothetical protein